MPSFTGIHSRILHKYDRPLTRQTIKQAVAAAALISILNTIVLFALRHSLPYLFTDELRVVSLVTSLIPLCAAMQVFDGMACMAHGLLRGIGKQSFGGFANLLTYYAVALPISFGTAFGALDWKLEGLWLGVTIGLAMYVSSFSSFPTHHSALAAKSRSSTNHFFLLSLSE